MENLVQHPNIKYLANILASVTEHAWLKAGSAIIYAAYAFSFDPTQSAGLKALLILICMDFVTGISAAKKSGEEIKSAGIFRSALKVLLYLMMVSAAHITELAVPIIGSFGDETIIAFLALTELISILENVGRLGFSVPQKMLNKLQELRDSK